MKNVSKNRNRKIIRWMNSGHTAEPIQYGKGKNNQKGILDTRSYQQESVKLKPTKGALVRNENSGIKCLYVPLYFFFLSRLKLGWSSGQGGDTVVS